MLKITGTREAGKAPIILVKVDVAGEPIEVRAILDMTERHCVLDRKFKRQSSDLVAITFVSDNGEEYRIVDPIAEYRELEGAEVKLGWSVLDLLNITLNDDRSFEIRGHDIP